MAFTNVGGFHVGGTGTSATLTHGLTINEGDLVVAYCNRNGTGTITKDADGETWTEAVNATVTSETARHSLHWAIMGSSPPSSFGWTFGSSDRYRVIALVIRPGAGNTAVIDLSANEPSRTASNAIDLVCSASSGRTVAANAVSFIFGGKDNQTAGGENYTQANNSYTGVQGSVTNQACAGAYRIWTTGGSDSTINIDTADNNDGTSDRTYSIHISFVEESTGNDEIDGSIDFDLTPTGDLNGTGELGGSIANAITLTADLAGSGALAGAADLDLTGSATLGGKGRLNGASVSNRFDIDLAGTLVGTGSLAGPAAIAFTGSATASYELSGQIDVTLTPTATLYGKGRLNGTSVSNRFDIDPEGTLTARSSLDGAIGVDLTGAATLGGLGALDGAAALSITGQVFIDLPGTARGVSPGELQRGR